MLATYGGNVGGEYASFSPTIAAAMEAGGWFQPIVTFDETLYEFDAATLSAVPLPTETTALSGGTTDVVLSLAAGTIPGLVVSSRVQGALTVQGATSKASLATGVNEGTAGSGTSSTSLAKPTGAANWTAGNLLGKFLLVTGGGGYQANRLTLRPILANTTTTVSVNAVAGMDSSTTFEIVALSSELDQVGASSRYGCTVSNCRAPIVLEGLAFSDAHSLDGLIDVQDCDDVLISGCHFAANTVQAALRLQRCRRVRVEHCFLEGGADVSVEKTQNASSTGCVSDGGGVIAFTGCVNVDVAKLSADSAPSRVLSVVHAFEASVEVTASNGAATPVYLEAVSNLVCSGGALSGSGNTGYGVELATSGRYNFAGCTISGSLGDVLFMGFAETWSTLSGTDYGMATEHASAVFANANYNKSHHYGNELHLGEQQFSSRVLLYGVFNPSQSTGLTATGSNSGDAFALTQHQFYRFDTVPSGSGCRIFSPDVAAVPGPRIVIKNAGANALKVYPPTGGTIDGGAVDSPLSLPAGSRCEVCCVSDDRKGWETLSVRP